MFKGAALGNMFKGAGRLVHFSTMSYCPLRKADCFTRWLPYLTVSMCRLEERWTPQDRQSSWGWTQERTRGGSTGGVGAFMSSEKCS